ncbi:MAG: DEAD/DEAH box helicase [Isosphaeraceae bacterium]
MPRIRKPSAVDGLAPGPVLDWFRAAFPNGPTPAQRLAWPAISRAENLLLVSPTGTGKTLAAFLAILDRLFHEHAQGTLADGLRCVYISPLRSLGYDIAANLARPLESIRERLGLESSPVRVGVRTGDTKPAERRKLRDSPPHLLVTTPESLSLMLAQPAWSGAWANVESLVIDEVHALAPTKRGADLAVSLERLAKLARKDPARIGLSATCRPPEVVARFLAGADRPCRVEVAPPPVDGGSLQIEVESLLEADESAYRPLTYRRLLPRLREAILAHRTTVVFANTRALAEKLTHDLRRMLDDETVAAHHSALDASVRLDVEARLRAGDLRAVVTSTSLELGVDIGSADLTVLVGLPGSASRCLQRIGRSGHRVGVPTRGLMLASSAAELAGSVVTAKAALEGRIEPIRPVSNPLDVLCQQLIGMACGAEMDSDSAFALVRRAAPFASLERPEFDHCLQFLAGELASPPGAFEPEPGSTPRWTSARIYKNRGLFGLRNGRVRRWFYSNVGTITSEESVRVLADGVAVGSLEGAYADRLQAGDRFVLDGRSLAFQRLDGGVVIARKAGGEPNLPRWTSDRQALSAALARDLARFRHDAFLRLSAGPGELRAWLVGPHRLDPAAADLLASLIEAQAAVSDVPDPETLLVEQSPDPEGTTCAFHAPLGRDACEALGRTVAQRLGKRIGKDLALTLADLGWSIRLPAGFALAEADLPALLDTDRFDRDLLEGLDRGELLPRRFRHVACTALMVLRRPEGGRTRVGGQHWVGARLYPLVRAACPDHPLLRETRRDATEDQLDARTAIDWLASRPAVRLRALDGPSPFTAAWIEPGGPEPLRFEPPEQALRRLHARLTGA